MSRSHDEQAIAMAGLFQAAAMVEQIATRGMVTQNSFETSVYSLFVTDPETTESVYGGARDLPYNLSLGLRSLQDMVEKKRSDHNRDLVRYALSMIHLERKLSQQPEMLSSIGTRLKQIREQARYFNADTEGDEINPSAFCHPTVIASLASLYQETISGFSFRIQVTGDPRNLQQAENAAKIRALLFAGIRAAMLWRQCGGSRWHLVFLKSRVRPSLKRLTRG